MYVNLESRSTVEKYTQKDLPLEKAALARGGSVHSNRGWMSVASDAEPVFS